MKIRYSSISVVEAVTRLREITHNGQRTYFEKHEYAQMNNLTMLSSRLTRSISAFHYYGLTNKEWDCRGLVNLSSFGLRVAEGTGPVPIPTLRRIFRNCQLFRTMCDQFKLYTQEDVLDTLMYRYGCTRHAAGEFYVPYSNSLIECDLMPNTRHPDDDIFDLLGSVSTNG